ncbi:glycosyltransferase family 4 protein [Streptomyces sp. NPDC092359]|uniref:glycosyltransferase family 4 protein n=1 Tax=Streptomyces sp. NPDC092359 TaxID=3366014 RepID=UPI00381048BA
MTTKPLTILTGINRGSGPSSGSLILANDLYRATAASGVRTIYLGRTPVDPSWKAAFDDLIPLSTMKRPQGPGFDDYVDELTREVGALVQQLQPDVIHAQNVGFALSVALSRTAGDIPIISLAHGTEVMAAERSPAEHAALREVATASTVIVSPTTVVATRIDRLTEHQLTNRLAIIPWGIRLADAKVRERPSTKTGPLSLVYAGRLDDNKSPVTAIEALSLAGEPHHLTVIGRGPLRQDLERRAAELGVRDRVRFEGYLPRTEVWKRLPRHDAFVFTTAGTEGFGLVLIEAQAHGLPVVYSDLPGVSGVLGRTGMAYSPGKPRSLALALDALGRDPCRRNALARASVRNAHRYDIEYTARQLHKLTLRVTTTRH